MEWRLLLTTSKPRDLQTNSFQSPIRVHTGPRNPGKSWNFVVTFSRTGKSWKNTAGPGKSWKSVKLNKVITFFLKQMSKIFECYYNVCVFGVLEKTIWSLEKSWKIVSEKGYEPWPISIRFWEKNIYLCWSWSIDDMRRKLMLVFLGTLRLKPKIAFTCYHVVCFKLNSITRS